MSKEVSKMLSMVLRHAPERIGISLDENGWINIQTLISKAQEAGYTLDLELLLETVRTSDKQRFTISEDGLKIRAAQGHSVKIDLSLEAVEPPQQLFHGTAWDNLDSILEKGLHAAKRQYVHLSLNEETAFKVGSRHGKAVVLKIDTLGMYRDGFKFFCADNGVWLTENVPPSYIKL